MVSSSIFLNQYRGSHSCPNPVGMGVYMCVRSKLALVWVQFFHDDYYLICCLDIMVRTLSGAGIPIILLVMTIMVASGYAFPNVWAVSPGSGSTNCYMSVQPSIDWH